MVEVSHLEGIGLSMNQYHSGRLLCVLSFLIWAGICFLPVWPLYKGEILVWFAPVYAAYAALFVGVNFLKFVFASTIVVIHISISVMLGRLLVYLINQTERFRNK